MEEDGTRDRQEEDPSGPPTHGIELLVPQEGGIQEEDARAAEESTDQGPRDFHGASPPLSGKSWAQRPQMPVILDWFEWIGRPHFRQRVGGFEWRVKRASVLLLRFMSRPDSRPWDSPRKRQGGPFLRLSALGG